MKKTKKMLAIVLAMAMVLGMSLTAFASGTDPDTTPQAPKKTQVEVTGVDEEDGVTVWAYQIIQYNADGYYEPVKVDGVELPITKGTGENALAPTLADAAKIATDYKLYTDEPGFAGKELTKPAGQNYYTNDTLTAGTWVIVVKGSEKYLYNPAIVSINQTPDGLSYGTLNLETTSWVDVDGNKTIYLKKGQPTIEKTVVGENTTVQYGDILQFQIVADIPSYTDEMGNSTYVISDTLTGLALVVDGEHAFTATVGKTAAEADQKSDNALTSIIEDASITDGAGSFKISFGEGETFPEAAQEFIKAHPGEKIVLKYYAKVTSDAELAVDEVNNTATLKYSTNEDVKDKTSETTHYTFGIDTKLNATTEEKTEEFYKLNEDGEIKKEEGVNKVTGPLQGAQFQLYYYVKADGTVDNDKTPAATSTKVFFKGIGAQGEEGETPYYVTGEDGRLSITGLEGNVQYYLVESKAPDGYSLNTTVIPVRIVPTYKADGKTLESYKVIMGDATEDAPTASYNYASKETVNPTVQNPYGFKNTKLSELPSTGGIGTTIFTIGGCAIMILAAGLFFASRRKSTK